jgi:hypothetical protein
MKMESKKRAKKSKVKNPKQVGLFDQYQKAPRYGTCTFNNDFFQESKKKIKKNTTITKNQTNENLLGKNYTSVCDIN